MTGMDRLHELGARGRARRESLRITLEEVYEDTGLTPTTQSRIESGKSVRGISYAKYEDGIFWSKGSCWRFLDRGEEPAEVQPPPDIIARLPPGQLLVAESTNYGGPERRRPAAPEEHIELLRRWAESDRGLTADQRTDFLAVLDIAERRIAKRRGTTRKRA